LVNKTWPSISHVAAVVAGANGKIDESVVAVGALISAKSSAWNQRRGSFELSRCVNASERNDEKIGMLFFKQQLEEYDSER
jgi:hypothetical protein